MDMTGFGKYNSPIGPLSIYSVNHFITEIIYKDEPDKVNSTPVIDKCIKQLDEYFMGTREVFDIAMLPSGTPFQKKVWLRLMKIPFGTIISYKDLAIDLGDVKLVRAVGSANGQNPIPVIVPCHRVIGSDGSLVGYAGGKDKKEWLLRHEKAGPYSQTELFK
jgi:methylated-DNA-[protein]-cysteine S-methyltransferase